jgi:hypothetical protein
MVTGETIAIGIERGIAQRIKDKDGLRPDLAVEGCAVNALGAYGCGV